MKNLLPGLALLSLLATASCKQTDGGPSNFWTVGANSYPAVTVKAGLFTFSYTLAALDQDTPRQHGIIFFFSGTTTPAATATPAAGTYKVVSNVDAAGQVSFMADGASRTSLYLSTGNDNVSATVSVVDGRLHISMPKAWAANGADSTQVSAEITQN